MRVWKVFPALLFLASTLNAQNGFYTNPWNAQSGFYTNPCDPVFYSGAYPPYCYQPYYYPQLSLSNTLLTVNNDGAMNALTRQVQELSEQVRELSAELALAKAQQLQPRPTLPEVIVPRPPAAPITFILKNGTQIVSQGYAIVGAMLWIMTPSGYVRTALSDVNLVATQRENSKRGITFEVLKN